MAKPTLKTFQAASERVRNSDMSPETKRLAAELFCDVFSSLNGSFKPARFMRECGFGEKSEQA